MTNLINKIKSLKDNILDRILFPKKDIYMDSLGIFSVKSKDADILWKYRKPEILNELDKPYIDRFCNTGLMSYNSRFDIKNKKLIKIAKVTPLGQALLKGW